jgi:glycosyltransferase involved in cell wall biosynthesis
MGSEPRSDRAFVLAPASWRRSIEWLAVLSAYIITAPPDSDATLYLDGRAADIDPATLRSIVQRACEYIAEGAPFAPVVLLEETTEAPTGTEPVEEAQDLLERLALGVRPADEQPTEIVRHALWVKALVDDIQLQIDSARLRAAPSVAVEGLPLVTVRIPTYGSTELLISRAIPSVLAGGYPNIELLVCSDGPQPEARSAVQAVDDPRVRYIELIERPKYPSRPESFWQTAGTFAINRLLDEARGQFIAPLDHDDAFTFDHIPVLLRALAQEGADFTYGQAMSEFQQGAWGMLGMHPLVQGGVVHAAVMYSRRLAHMRYDPHAWLLDEPGDWNLWRRVRDAGAVVCHVPACVAVHFKERSSIGHRIHNPMAEAEVTAGDILATSAQELLDVTSWIRSGRGLTGRAGGSRRPPAPERPRRLAWLDSHFPLSLSGFRWHEARAMLALVPEMTFFSAARTGEDWPGAVHPLARFPELAVELGITDVYSVFLNFAVSLLRLQSHPGAATCAGIPVDPGVAPVLAARGVRFHTTLYPGGGLVTGTDPELLRAVAARSETVFTNTAEVVAAVPEAIRIAAPMAVDYYEFRPRKRRRPFSIAFAADDRPRKGLDTALAALARLDDRFHLHIAGPNERYLEGLSRDRITFHGTLPPERLRDLYWNCDAFVSPVRPEGPDGPPGEVGLVDGFPTSTACEALASGCALISSNPRQEDWILRAGEHYAEVPMGDPDALAAALDDLERDRGLRDALASRGAVRIKEIMDVNAVARAKLAAMGLVSAPASAG